MTKTQLRIAGMLRKAGRKVAVVDETMKCGRCDGKGELMVLAETVTGRTIYNLESCRLCGGTGRLPKR